MMEDRAVRKQNISDINKEIRVLEKNLKRSLVLDVTRNVTRTQSKNTRNTVVQNSPRIKKETNKVHTLPVIVNNEFLTMISEEACKIIPAWSKSLGKKSHNLINLNNSSSEYIEVETKFKRYCRTYDVTKIQRVENPFLLGHYLLKKQKMEKQLGSNNVQEREMFHGTDLKNTQGICSKNLNWRLSGNARGHKFGQGVSFSPDSFYSTHYTNDNVMFLVKVLVSKSHVGTPSLHVPEEGYDTTDNGKDSVYVKYEDNDFYPSYIIHFELGESLSDSDTSSDYDDTSYNSDSYSSSYYSDSDFSSSESD